MKSSQRSFRNFAVLVLSQVVFSMAFAYLFAAKIFPVKQLAVGVIFFAIMFAIGYWRVFRNMSREYWKGREWPEASIDDETRKQRGKTVQRLSRIILFLQVALWGGLWMGRADIRQPAIWVGVAVNLCFTGLVIRIILRLRKSLRLPPANPTLT